jgi:hypothetical protein
MIDFPDEIIVKILLYCLIFKVENSVKNILNLKLVSKQFNTLLKDKNLCTKLYSHFKASDLIIKTNIKNNLFIQPLIEYNYMVSKTPKELNKIFSYEDIFFLPETEILIDSLNNWSQDLDTFNFNKKIMRGYSKNGILYLAFRYNNYIENKTYVEIIYEDNNSNKTFWTTCGTGSNIANSLFLQKKTLTSNDLYLFNEFTINYIKRLINGTAGSIYYIQEEGYYEDSINLLTLQDA